MRLTMTLLCTLELLLYSVALTPHVVNVLKPPTMGAPDVLTLPPTPTNRVDVIWANISFRFSYSLVSGTGSPGVWETKQAIFAMGG
jgi:hypothetical protein